MDIRIQRSQNKLKDTFAELLKIKELKDITVLELCKKANINRTTFYKYYTDIDDLTKKIETNLITELEDEIKKINRNYLLTYTSYIIENINKNNNILKYLISKNGDHTFLRRILYKVYDESLLEWKHLLKKANDTDLDNIFNFIIDGSIGIINKWIDNKCKEDPKTISIFINKICMSGLSSFI